MSIWLLAGILAVALGTAGFFLGGIRALVCVIGVFVGILLTGALDGPTQEHIIPLLLRDYSFSSVNLDLKVNSPFWSEGLSPLISTLLVNLVFVGLSFAAYLGVANKVNNRFSEVKQIRWNQMMRSWGLVSGIVWALVWTVFIGQRVYFPGYATAQLTSPSDPPDGFGLINGMRRDMDATGLSKVVAGWDTTSSDVYDAIDLAGLIYTNPGAEIRYRLSGYPLFLDALHFDSKIKGASTDGDLIQFFSSRGSYIDLYENESFQGILSGTDLDAEIDELEIEDVTSYLETGKSGLVNDRIVGRWQIDQGATSIELRREMEEVPRSLLGFVRRGLMNVSVKVIATPQGRILFNSNVDHSEALQLMARYQVENPQIVLSQIEELVSSVAVTGEGSWERDEHRFQVSVAGEALTGLVVDGDLKFTDSQGREYVFYPD